MVIHRLKLPFNRAQFFANRFEKVFGRMWAESFFADPENIAPDIAKIEWIET